MIIFYGKHSIRVKTYTSVEIGLDEQYSHLKFQLYQHFFFIFFIPVFPITKFWKVKDKTTNKEVETDAELRTKLNLFEARTKTPYWAYTGFFILITPVLLLIGLLIFNLTSEVKRSAEKELQSIEKRREHDKLNEEDVEMIKQPIKGDVYQIKMIEMIPKVNVNGKKKGFKKGEREELTYIVTGFSSNSIELELTKIPDYFTTNLIIKDKVTVAKQDLINISGNYKTLNLYETIKINGTNVQAEAVFVIKQIDRVLN